MIRLSNLKIDINTQISILAFLKKGDNIMAKTTTIVSTKPSKKTATKVKKKLAPIVSKDSEKTGEELVIENLAVVSHLIKTLGETLEMLVQKTENMAYHIIATEEILAEIVAENGLNLALVNERIRNTITTGTDNLCNPSKAIDIAAAIVSPLPRR